MARTRIVIADEIDPYPTGRERAEVGRIMARALRCWRRFGRRIPGLTILAVNGVRA